MVGGRPTRFLAPRRLQRALAAKSRWGARGKWLAGGTDVVVQMKRGESAPECLISLHRVGGLDHIREKGDGLSIGSMVTLRDIARSPLIARKWGLLRQAVLEIGSEAIRAAATLGGNICNASPAADSLPALLAMEAELELKGAGHERSLPICDFFQGPSLTALREDEIVKSISLPPLPPDARSIYLKLGRKRRGDIALVGVALMLVPQQGGLVKEVRIALGGVSPTPMRAREAEARAEGRALDDSLMEIIAKRAAEESRPMTDIRGSAGYKREMVGALVRRGLTHLRSMVES